MPVDIRALLYTGQTRPNQTKQGRREGPMRGKGWLAAAAVEQNQKRANAALRSTALHQPSRSQFSAPAVIPVSTEGEGTN